MQPWGALVAVFALQLFSLLGLTVPYILESGNFFIAPFIFCCWNLVAPCVLTKQVIRVIFIFTGIFLRPCSHLVISRSDYNWYYVFGDFLLGWIFSAVGASSALIAAALYVPGQNSADCWGRNLAKEAMRNISAKLDVVSNYEITFSLIAGTLFVCHRGQFLLSLVALIVSWSIGTLLNINNRLILSVYRHFLFLLTELAMAPGALVLMIFAGKYDRKGGSWGQIVSDEAPVVLLLHGHGANDGQWVRGLVSLSLHHWAKEISVITVNYELEDQFYMRPANHQGVEILAEIVCRRLKVKFGKAYKTMSKPRKLILLGHSLGGLVASYISQNKEMRNGLEIECGLKCKAVYSVSTPFLGSALLTYVRKNYPKLARANRLFSKVGDQMEVGSVFLETLLKACARNSSGITYRYAAGECDYLVRPKSALPFKEVLKERQLFFCGEGHYTVAISDSVWKRMITWISEDIQ